MEDSNHIKRQYTQDWVAYNRSQTREKLLFQVLLHDLCRGLDEPLQERGRPRLLLSDMLFGAAFKVYSTLSGRRFHTDLKEAHARGYISKVPHFNAVFKCLETKAVTPYLRQLIIESSLPLKAVEVDFAVDSSGFGTYNYFRWFSVKHKKEVRSHDWLKVHLMCGVKTNIVTAVEISGRHANDYTFFKPLVETTARSGFELQEVSADRMYLGASNMHAALKAGAMPYIPFKTNSTGEIGSPGSIPKSTIWNRLFHLYSLHQEEFLSHYHKRSNVETVFWMLKSKFGEKVRSKIEVAQTNEALCKVLCHNICCIIQSIHELNIDPTFWQKPLGASEPPAPNTR
jgi:transposase